MSITSSQNDDCAGFAGAEALADSVMAAGEVGVRVCLMIRLRAAAEQCVTSKKGQRDALALVTPIMLGYRVTMS